VTSRAFRSRQPHGLEIAPISLFSGCCKFALRSRNSRLDYDRSTLLISLSLSLSLSLLLALACARAKDPVSGRRQDHKLFTSGMVCVTLRRTRTRLSRKAALSLGLSERRDRHFATGKSASKFRSPNGQGTMAARRFRVSFLIIAASDRPPMTTIGASRSFLDLSFS